MIEIMAGVYVTSFILSMMLVAWNFVAVSRQVKSESLRRLNINLQKIGFYWSMTREDFCSLDEGNVEQDSQAAIRSTLMLGLLSLGSAIGFFLLFAITITMRLLKSNRRGNAVFHSELVKNIEMPSAEVQKLHSEFSNIF